MKSIREIFESKYFIRYLIEFVVIIASILISFFIEKQNIIKHESELKNQSLKRLITNIEADILDSKENNKIHSKIVNYSKILIERGDQLFENDKDSLGYLFTYASTAMTIFVDNKEEYFTLRNSGLLELIKNDKLVSLLQSKYSNHQFYKEIEKNISSLNQEMAISVNTKTSYKNKATDEKGEIRFYGVYIDENPLTNFELNLIQHKSGLSNYYLKKINEGIQSDSIIIEYMKNEIKKK